MRVLHLSSATTWRGGEQQIAYLIKELHQKGVENILLCPRDSVLGERKIPEIDLKIRYQKRGSIDLFVSRTLKQISITEKIDLIHVHDSHAHNYAWAAASFWRMKTPCIVTRRVDFGIHKTSQMKYNHPSIRRIICVSEYIRQQLMASLKETERIIRIYSGIDVEKFSTKTSNFFRTTFNIPENCLLFGNIAAMAKHKDYMAFVELAKSYYDQDNPDARFLIIGGDAGEEKKIKKKVAEAGLKQKIIFTGFQEAIENKISELDVFICTSRMEGLGTSVLDAFAAKVPVISTNAGGLPEIAVHRETALISDVDDIDTMLEHLEQLLTNKKLKMQLQKKAYKFVQDFDVKSTKKKVFKIYKEVLAEEDQSSS